MLPVYTITKEGLTMAIKKHCKRQANSVKNGNKFKSAFNSSSRLATNGKTCRSGKGRVFTDEEIQQYITARKG